MTKTGKAPVLRVTRGFGSNPKLWGMAELNGRRYHVMELDLPVTYGDGTTCPLTAILRGPALPPNGRVYTFDGLGNWSDRAPYASVDAVVAALAAAWPGATVAVDLTATARL